MSINKQIKTPCYIIELDKVRQNFDKLNTAIIQGGRSDLIAYSIKANYNPQIIKILNEIGAFFEVCSKYELELLNSMDIPNKKIVLNGFVQINELQTVADLGLIILDSKEQFLEWSKNPNLCVGLRVNLDYFTLDKRFKNKSSRFGINMYDDDVSTTINQREIRNKIVALHCHLSGNTRNPSIYTDALTEIKKIIEWHNLDSLKYIDLGGGFKVSPSHWGYEDYISAINRKLVELKLDSIKIIYEPGNSLVNNVASYHTKVIGEKYLNGKLIKITDGTVLQLPKINANLLKHTLCNTTGIVVAKQVVVGSTCKESDIILELKNEDELQIGSTLIINNVGAYSINEINPLILGIPNTYVI